MSSRQLKPNPIHTIASHPKILSCLCIRIHLQLSQQPSARLRHKRLHQHGQIVQHLNRLTQHLRRAIRIRLYQLPWLMIRQIFIPQTRQFHHLKLRIPKLILPQQLHHRHNILLHHRMLAAYHRRTIKQTILFLYRLHRWHHTLIIFLHQHQNTVGKIAQNPHQLRIHTGLIILPCKLTVLGLRRNRREHIAQLVLPIWHLLQILIQPNRPISTCRYFLSLQIQKLIGRHLLRQHIPIAA